MMQVVANKPIEVSLPVKLTGTAVGVTKGGKLMQKLRKIKVKGLAKDLPAVVEINVSKLDLGGNIQVKDVPFENIDIKSPSSAAVASVEIPRSLRSQMKGK
jgi:large subunit ribosomal protein L25